jgi:hypothetical protein
MARKKPKRFNEGGISEEQLKAEGLEASKGDKVGFFERLRMGNIDAPDSEAYRRFGAGRGRAARAPVERPAYDIGYEGRDAALAASAAPMPAKYDDLMSSKEPGWESGTAPASVSKPAKTSAAKPAAKTTQGKSVSDSGNAKDLNYSNEGRGKVAPRSDYSNEGRGRGVSMEQQYARAIAEASTPEGKAKRKQQESEQALERVTPETALLPGGGLKGLASLAKKLATPKMATYSQPLLASPTKQLPYDKAGAVGRARQARAAAREEEMLAENAARYGLDPKAPGYEAAAGVIRKELGGKDFSFKRGGSVKKKPEVKKMASGGMTSKASSRGDGIAQRGKTRGKIC